jgi:hypothetical protein
MSTTILNLDDNKALDVTALEGFDRSKFQEISSSVNGANREVVYAKTTGDESHPLTVRVGIYPKPAQNAGVGCVNVSVKIQTFAENDDDPDDVKYLPVDATLAWQMPGNSGCPDPTDMLTLLGPLFFWMVPVTAGVPQEDALDLVKFGVATGLASFTDTKSA